MTEPAPNRVFLVGPMGSGKTTLGRRVAEQLGLTFIDCDEEIERRTGASVNLIFDIEGEAGFRARETALLRELSERDGVLIATGGGVIQSEENRRILRDRGFVVWLPATVNQQLQRLEKDRKRPLLQAPDRRERLEALARARNPLYAKVAHLTYRSRHRNVVRAAEGLARALDPDRPMEESP
jgi:shikimate kinase